MVKKYWVEQHTIIKEEDFLLPPHKDHHFQVILLSDLKKEIQTFFDEYDEVNDLVTIKQLREELKQRLGI